MTRRVSILVACMALAHCAGGDGVASEDAPACAPLAADVYELGVTRPRVDGLTFTQVADGDTIPLEFGSQGSWMVSLGLQTNAALSKDEPVVVTAALVGMDGETISRLLPTTSPVTDGGDGYRYVLHRFLVLAASDPVHRVFDWDGEAADLSAVLEGPCGLRLEATRRVQLILP